MFPDLTRDDVFRLETRRLWLRWPRQADSQAVVRLAGDKSVAEMTAVIPHPYSVADADSFILHSRRSNMEGAGLTLAITPKAKPACLIGVVSVVPDGTGGALGYWIGEPYWGNGYATEAAQALVDATFTLTSLPRLSATARTDNEASRYVLEACGFRRTGGGNRIFVAGGGQRPVDQFSLERATWDGLSDRGASGAWSRSAPLHQRAGGLALAMA